MRMQYAKCCLEVQTMTLLKQDAYIGTFLIAS